MAKYVEKLDKILKHLSVSERRFITIVVEAEPTDQVAHDAALQQIRNELGIQPDDTVVEIRCWSRSQGEILPRLSGIVPCL